MSTNKFIPLLIVFLGMLSLSLSLNGQISIPNTSFTDSQDFSTLANSGTSSLTPPGWAFAETGSNANGTYTAGTGSGTAGDTYSFGPASTTERAFGGLNSGTLVPTIGVCYTNNTGSTITGFTINYVGETWRVGTAGRSDGITFQYNQNVTSITGSGTWTNFPALDYFNPGQAVIGGGSLQHSAPVSSSLTGLTIASGNTFCMRWNSVDASGADDGIGVDDYTLTALTVLPTPGVTLTESGGSTNIAEGGANDSYTMVLKSQPTSNVVISINPDVQSTVSPTMLTFTSVNWAVPQTVVVTAVDDNIVEGNHTSTIMHTASSSDLSYNGISINNVVANITDNDFPVNPCPTLTTSVTNTSCGLNNGEIVLNVNGGIGPFTYSWNNGASTKDISGLASGNYSVTVTSLSCTAGVTISAMVASSTNPNPTLSTSVTNAACNQNNGQIILTTTGGTMPFSYLWSNGSINKDLLNVASGTYMVTVTSIGSGCAGSTATATVGTISDSQPPMIACPSVAPVSCSSQVPAPNPGSVIASDNCTNPPNVIFISDGISNQICANKYTITRTYQASDAAGNTSLCTHLINVNDVVQPNFTTSPLPADITISCSATVPQPATLTASDNCGGSVTVTFMQTTSAGSCISNQSITRTWTAIDNCNNSKTHMQVITIVDNTAPVFNPPLPANITISCDNIPSAGVLTATDNCSGITPIPAPVIWFNEIHYDNTGADVGEFIELAGTAGINLSDYSVILYNGADGKSYDTKVLSGTIPNESNGFGTTVVNYPTNGIQNGAPDGMALVFNPTNAVLYFLSYEGSFVATSGPATGMTSVDIGVSETGSEPIGLSLRLTGTGSNYPNFTWQAPSAQSPGSLNPGQTMVSSTPPPSGQITYGFSETKVVGSCPNAGTITRTWTATDACSNTAYHTQTITVIDNTPPVFVQPLPADISVECDAIPAAPVVRAVDNCGPLNAIASPAIWINEIHYDNAGTDVGEFIEIAGTAGLNLNGYSLVLYNGANGLQYSTTPLSGSIPNQINGFGAIALTYSTDGIQNGAPDGMALVQGNTVIQYLSYEGSFVAVDGPAAGLTSVNIGVQEAGTEPVGQSLQLKGSGNKYADFTWTGPATASPGSINTGVGQLVGPTLITATLNSTVIPGSCPQSYTLRRTWTATDLCSNSSGYTQNITVRDTKAPAFVGTLPTNITIECDQPVPAAPALTATDNCDPVVPVTLISTTAAGSCPQSYTITRTYTAADDCLNSTNYVYTITVRDTKAPSFAGSIPQSITIECTQPVPTAPTLTATDNCDPIVPVIYTASTAVGKCPQESVITRTYTATDDCGNSAVINYTITIVDNKAPVINGVGPSVVIECDQPLPPLPTVTITDNCDPKPTITFIEKSTKSNYPTLCDYYNYTITRIWTAVDACGNQSVKTQSIKVQDTKAPTWVSLPPQFITVQCNEDNNNNVDPIASDGCDSDPSVILDIKYKTNINGCVNNYTAIYTWTAGDKCGNITQYTQYITVLDSEPPVIACPDNITKTSNIPLVVTWPNAKAFDYCDGYPLIKQIAGPPSGSLFLPDTKTIIVYEATDDCGNTATCSFVVTITSEQTGPGKLADDMSQLTSLSVAQNKTIEGKENNKDLVHANTGQGIYNSNGINKLELYQNEPNPFGASTTISFLLPEDSNASLSVTDLGGREIYKINGKFVKGINRLRLEADKFPAPGIYLYRLVCKDASLIKKMIFIK